MSQLTAPELLERVLEGNRRWAEGNKATKPFETLPPRKAIRKKV